MIQLLDINEKRSWIDLFRPVNSARRTGFDDRIKLVAKKKEEKINQKY